MNFESDGYFQSLLFETSPLGIAIVGSEGILKGSNPAFHEIIGRGNTAPATLSLRELSHLGDREELDAALKELTSGACNSACITAGHIKGGVRRIHLHGTSRRAVHFLPS